MALVSAVLTLRPESPVTIPAYLGRATHAWFLDQVRRLNPVQADSLHAPSHERSFTVSNLWDGRTAGIAELPTYPKVGNSPSTVVAPDQHCFLRLSSYEPTLSALLTERLLPSLPETIVLAGATFRIVDATSDAHQHPWAGQTTMQDLLVAHTLGGQPEPLVALRFASPTVFRSQEIMVPLPLPRLVFEGLVRRWNAVAPIALPDEVISFAKECVAISQHRIRTKRVVFGKGGKRGAFPGFFGHVIYAFRVKDRYWMELIHLLAAFALYAGVGQWVTLGLGQVRKQ